MNNTSSSADPNRKWRVAGLLVLLGLAMSLHYFGDSAFGQMWRMRTSHREAPRLQAAIQKDPRFAKVTFAGGGTGRDAHIFVRGTLQSEADLPDLTAAVAQARPRVAVSFAILKILMANEKREREIEAQQAAGNH